MSILSKSKIAGKASAYPIETIAGLHSKCGSYPCPKIFDKAVSDKRSSLLQYEINEALSPIRWQDQSQV